METNIAVLIDFENIAAGAEKEGLGRLEVGLIMNRFREKGRVLIARSYADWGRFARFKKDLLFEGVVLFELSAHGMNDKNRADVAMVVDCMDLAFNKPFIDTFVIVSGDSDFTPLILKLRELNKRIIGCGTRRSTSRLIVEACDEFVFYDTLRGQRSQRSRRGQESTTNTLTREEAMELVTASLESLQREEPKPVYASMIKEHILRKEPAFSEVDLGFTSLTRFLDFCQRQGIVKLIKDEKGGGYLVDFPDAEEAKPAAPVAELSPGAQRLYDQLTGEELEPLTRELRELIATHIVDSVAERERSKKRVNLNWVTQDIIKEFKDDPRLSSRRIKAIVNAMHRGGVFLHTDGDPVRSFFASFFLKKNAEQLVEVLDEVYVRRLAELNKDLNDASKDIAELLFGDRRRTKPGQEMLAWLSAGGSSAEADEEDEDAPVAGEDEVPPDEDDASPTAVAIEAADAEAAEEAAPKKRRRRRRGKGGAEEAEAAEDASAPEAQVAAPEPEQAEVAEELPPEPEEDDAKPKRRRKPRRKVVTAE
ncbi:MAG: NYN domain-containing protein [Alphaproteobacteria bacterium]|nr:NYN domain-containing protein [Alphaproteobacteria bacterium]